MHKVLAQTAVLSSERFTRQGVQSDDKACIHWIISVFACFVALRHDCELSK